MTDQNNGEPAGSANVTSLSSDAAAEMIMAMEEATTEEAPVEVADETVETPETNDEPELEANADGEAEPAGDNEPDENENSQDGEEIEEGEENQPDEIEAYDLDKISGTTQIRLRDGTVITGAELKENIDLYLQENKEDINLLKQANEVKAQNDAMRETLQKQSAEFEQQRLQYEQEANKFSQIAPVAYQELKNSLPEVPNPPTDAEWDEDHFAASRKQAEHQRARNDFNQKYHRMEQIKAEAQNQYQASQNKAAQEGQAAAQAEGQKLIELMPELRDEAKRVEFKNNLLEGAKKHFGYSDEQLSKIASAQDVVALNAAIEHAELKANPPKPATKTTTTTRNKPLAGSSRRESQGEVAANEKTKSFAKVRQTGRSEDAAALIANLNL